MNTIHPMRTALELLSPAKNAAIGKAAIDHGADAVYIGGPRFSARAEAANSIEDISGLITYAHQFSAKVYVALNTILTDHEIPKALELIYQIHDAGADGLIVQDMGLLECNLPPIPLIASTQMHNDTPEKIKFLERIGFSRVILARELSLPEIQSIRDATTSIELEFFVHGALCVSYSGQCYMSLAVSGRSGNRGVCGQPCRHVYSLADGDGNTLIKNKHLLSLKDLNLSDSIFHLVKAGITSFKIEGRYKDAAYVKNVTAAYRRRLDQFIEQNPFYQRASSGKSIPAFEPDLEKTFNRGYTPYFVFGRNEKIAAMDTPKSLGKPVGTIISVGRNFFRMKGQPIANGDGLCFFTPTGVLCGFRVNRVENGRIYPSIMADLKTNILLYRNHDHIFYQMLGKKSAVRKIPILIRFNQDPNRICVHVMDEDGNSATATMDLNYEPCRRADGAIPYTTKQLSKTGNTIYEVQQIAIDTKQPGFVPAAALNQLRRNALAALTQIRLKHYQPKRIAFYPNTIPYPEKKLYYPANVLNQYARGFYARHGAKVCEHALEGGNDPQGKIVMTTRYCLCYELDACPRYTRSPVFLKKPLYLMDGQRRYRVFVDCDRCRMLISLESALAGGG